MKNLHQLKKVNDMRVYLIEKDAQERRDKLSKSIE